MRFSLGQQLSTQEAWEESLQKGVVGRLASLTTITTSWLKVRADESYKE